MNNNIMYTSKSKTTFRINVPTNNILRCTEIKIVTRAINNMIKLFI